MSNERFICLCGAEYVTKTWKVWFSITGDVSEVTGLSCPTKGCPANNAEHAEKRLAALQKLTPEERMLLGLMYKPDYATVQPTAVPLDPSISHLQRGDVLTIENGVAKLK